MASKTTGTKGATDEIIIKSTEASVHYASILEDDVFRDIPASV